MTPIEYLRLQAKNLHKDFKTQTFSFDKNLQRNVYKYDPKFFKIDLLINDFDINEEKFQLGNAQHVIAKLCGLDKWQDLSKASPSKIELSTLLYKNMDKLEVRDWDQYVLEIETSNDVKLDDDCKLKIFKEGFLEWQQDVSYDDYRLSKDDEKVIEWESNEPDINISDESITSLPLEKDDREELIEAANWAFERIFKRIEPNNPELTRKHWNAERYIDEELLKPNMLSIDKDYVLSMIDAFLVGYVIQLAAETDEIASDGQTFRY